MAQFLSVAVVILNWNGRAFLQRFLPSVASTTCPGARIVVADNASTDDSAEWVEARFPDVEVVRLAANRGFAGGYNEALARVDADAFLLLNQDVDVDPGWLEPLAGRLAADPGIGAIMPKLLDEADRTRFEFAGAAGGMIDALGYPFCRGRLFERIEADEGQYDRPVEVFWASGAAMLVRADLYRRLGGLDGDFFAHMEEIDLCWRIRRAGYRVEYLPSSRVYHVGGGSLDRQAPRKTFLNFRNNMRMLVKNLPPGRLAWTLPLRLGLDTLAAIRDLLRGRFGHGLAALRGSWRILPTLPYWIARRRQDARRVRDARTGPDRSRGPGWYHGSVVASYFLGGRRTWREVRGG